VARAIFYSPSESKYYILLPGSWINGSNGGTYRGNVRPDNTGDIADDTLVRFNLDDGNKTNADGSTELGIEFNDTKGNNAAFMAWTSIAGRLNELNGVPAVRSVANYSALNTLFSNALVDPPNNRKFDYYYRIR
jgi:hypothetical protein